VDLTVAVNTANLSIAALTKLLIDTKVITEEDMDKYLREAAENFKEALDRITKEETKAALDPSFDSTDYVRSSFVPGFDPTDV
jgi:hypothetical protein